MTEDSNGVSPTMWPWWLGPAVYGGVVFFGIHLALVLSWTAIVPVVEENYPPFWLDSVAGFFLASGLLIMAASALALWRSSAPWRAAVAMECGIMVSTTVIVFHIGPGTVFPIGLAFCLVLSSVAVCIGVVIVVVPRILWRTMTDRHAGTEGT